MSALDYFLGIVQAYQQVGMLIGALVCLGLGGLVLGNCLYWRIHALRASGTIIGVVTSGGSYTPVYRYALPDGQTHVAKSDTSSGAVRGKETGRIVPLMVSAHDPTQARAANNYLLDVVGLLLIMPGVCFGYTALTAYPIVKFRTDRNVLVEFKDNVGSNPPSHRPGDKVTVLYLADNPRQEAIIDRGVWWSWRIPGIIFSFAAFLAGLLVVILRGGKPLDTPGVATSLLKGTSQSRV